MPVLRHWKIFEIGGLDAAAEDARRRSLRVPREAGPIDRPVRPAGHPTIPTRRTSVLCLAARRTLAAMLRVVDPLLERTVRSAIPRSGSVGGQCDHRYHQEGRRRSRLRLHRRRGCEGILLPSRRPRLLARLRPPRRRRARHVRDRAEPQGPARQRRSTRPDQLAAPSAIDGRHGRTPRFGSPSQPASTIAAPRLRSGTRAGSSPSLLAHGT